MSADDKALRRLRAAPRTACVLSSKGERHRAAVCRGEGWRRSRSAPVSVNALIRSSLGISSGKPANLANSVSEKIDADTDVSSDWSRRFPSRSLRYRL